MADGSAAAASSCEVDLGNLMTYDPSQHAAAASRFTNDQLHVVLTLFLTNIYKL